MMRLLLVLLLIMGQPAAATETPAAGTPDSGGFGFTYPEQVTLQGYDDHAREPFFSRDGKTMFFSDGPNLAAQTDIHYAEFIDPLTFLYRGKVGYINSDAPEGSPTMDSQGNLYFFTPRDHDVSGTVLHVAGYRDGWAEGARPLDGDYTPRKLPWYNMDGEISADGNTLYITETRIPRLGRALKAADIILATRAPDGSFKRHPRSDEIMAKINTRTDIEYAPAISGDELTLYFTSVPQKTPPLARRKKCAS
jgi:hypothetical protein